MAVPGMVSPANAQSCNSYVQNIINNYHIPRGYEGVMQVSMTSNRADGQYVSYAEMPSMDEEQGSAGALVYHPAWGPFPAYLQGTLTQYFCNRRFNARGFFNDPFNPQSTDKLGITIYP